MAKKTSKGRSGVRKAGRGKKGRAAAKSKRARPTTRKAKVKSTRRAAKPAPRAVKRPAKKVTSAPARPNPVRELAKRIVDLTLANDDEAAFGLYADTVTSEEMGMPPTTGIEAIRQKFAMWRGMISQADWTARNVWVDGDTIVVEWDGRVTLAANGREVHLHEIAVHEVRDGKIVRERFFYDPSQLRPSTQP